MNKDIEELIDLEKDHNFTKFAVPSSFLLICIWLSFESWWFVLLLPIAGTIIYYTIKRWREESNRIRELREKL